MRGTSSLAISKAPNALRPSAKSFEDSRSPERRGTSLSHVCCSLSLSAAAVVFVPPRKRCDPWRRGKTGPTTSRSTKVASADGHVTSDSFSTPASRRRAFIPTPRSTPPFASLDQHPAGPDWSTRRNCWVGEHPATRGFYGNGGGVARDNLVIGIAATAAGTSMGPSDVGCGVEGRRTGRRTVEDGGSRDGRETKASAK